MGKTVKGHPREVNGKMQWVKSHQRIDKGKSTNNLPAPPKRSNFVQVDWDQVYKDAQSSSEHDTLTDIYNGPAQKDEQVLFMLARNQRTPREVVTSMVEETVKTRDREMAVILMEHKNLLPRPKTQLSAIL